MTNYQLAEQRDQQRLAEWQSDPEMENLDKDIALVRMMIEQSAQRGQPNQVLAGEAVLTRLLQTQKQVAVLNSHFISKRVLTEIVGPQVVQALLAAVNHLPDREAIVDHAMQGILKSISAARNEQQDIKLLKAT